MICPYLRWFLANLWLSFFVSSYNNFARRFARHNSQLFSETWGMIPNSAGVEQCFTRMIFKGIAVRKRVDCGA